MKTVQILARLLITAMLIWSPVSNADEDSADQSKAVEQLAAVDQLDLGSTSIRGNQELPKVMYIVPWKESGSGELQGRPVNSLIDEVLAPLDRDVFRRQIRYFDQLYGPGKGNRNENTAIIPPDDAGS